MAKKRNLSAAVIFDTAAKLTEAEGLNGLTIGRLAKELNVKPASLYNHIDGFEDVRRHLAGLAIRELNDAFLQAAAGRSRDRYGQPMTIKLNGKVEPYFENPPEGEAQEGAASEG